MWKKRNTRGKFETWKEIKNIGNDKYVVLYIKGSFSYQHAINI